MLCRIAGQNSGEIVRIVVVVREAGPAHVAEIKGRST